MNQTQSATYSRNLKPTAAAIDAELVVIAHKHLGFVDLETRKWDSMDFKDVHVARVKAALQAAYEAGFKAAQLSATLKA